MKIRNMVIVAILASLLGGGSFLVYNQFLARTAGIQAAGSNQPVAVKTATVAMNYIDPGLEANASVVTTREAYVVARTQGVLNSLTAERGEVVGEGETVACLEDTNQSLAVEKAGHQINIAATALDNARTNYERISSLYNAGAVSKAELDAAQRALDDAETAASAAATDMKLARQSLEETKVLAPITGRVVERYVEPGQMVFSGQQLVKLVDTDSIRIRASLDAPQFALLESGQEAVFYAQAFPGRSYLCTAVLLNDLADNSNRTYPVEFALESDSDLEPGMYGKIVISSSSARSCLSIPRDSLVSRDEQGLAEVYVVNGGKVSRIQIQTGESDGQNIEVINGLSSGQKVVTFGQHLIQDGTPVVEGE